MKTKEAFDKFKKTNWLHEYAENGILNYEDFCKAQELFIRLSDEHERDLRKTNAKLVEENEVLAHEKDEFRKEANAWKEGLLEIGHEVNQLQSELSAAKERVKELEKQVNQLGEAMKFMIEVDEMDKHPNNLKNHNG